MKELVLDVECTFQKLEKGASSNLPFDPRNKLVCTAYWGQDIKGCVDTEEPSILHIQSLVNDSDLVIGFNIKFDYHWLRSAGVDISNKSIWDCQLAEFILRNQVGAMPSLDQACARFGLDQKLDVVRTEYWDKGINTDKIPWNVLSEYALKDVELTYLLYHRQQAALTPSQKRLLRLMCQDLHILAEMEWNGISFDSKLCKERSAELALKINAITSELNSIYPDVPINFGSSQQLSAFLYGGVIEEETKDHVGFFKSGARVGQPKYAKRVIEHQLPRLYTPLKNSEMATEGVYSTAEGTLKKLKGRRKIVDMLLELSKLSKLNETYYDGLPKLNNQMGWAEDMIHGQFNQCTTITGRLSSAKPNLQNFASDLQDVFITRY